MLKVTDQYSISPATSKRGFSCHPSDLPRKFHLCHGSCKSWKRGTRPPSSHYKTSSETQGQSVGSEEKAGQTFSSRGKEPLGTETHRTISKNSSGCRLLIGHKKCFVLLCPIGEQFLLSSFREFVHDGYCLATLARFVHQACAYKGNFYFLLS